MHTHLHRHTHKHRHTIYADRDKNTQRHNGFFLNTQIFTNIKTCKNTYSYTQTLTTDIYRQRVDYSPGRPKFDGRQSLCETRMKALCIAEKQHTYGMPCVLSNVTYVLGSWLLLEQ